MKHFTESLPVGAFDRMLLLRPSAAESEQDCACSEAIFVPPAGPAETDCACAPASGVSPFTAEGGRLWQRAPLLYRAPLPAGHALLLSAHSPTGPAVLSPAAQEALAAFARPRPLAEGFARRLAEAGLLVPVGETQPAAVPAPENDTLTVWLHVTPACHLRCAYCYVPRQGRAMDPATGLSALETAFRTADRHGFQAVKLKYAGGEPTLNLPLVRFLHRQAGLLARRHGLRLSETLLTNGVALDDGVLDFAAAAGLRLAISLDPSRRTHDGRRTLPDGSGTFERICRNLERAVGRGLRPFLSITLCGEEGEEEAEAVALALDLDLPFHLNFVRPADGRISPERIERLIVAVRAALARVEAALPGRSLLGILDRADFSRPHRYPCAAGRAYLVVDERGRLSPCQMELSHPAGDLALEDPLPVLGATFPNPAVEERAGCASCPWRYGCAGGCPWLARKSAGRASVPSPYCPAYRVLYPELLRLEGLRLLRQAGR